MIIGVVGLGLIGGSMAKAITHYSEHTVLGMDISEQVVLKAKMLGVISGELTHESITDCDIIILALYPHDTISFISENAERLKGTTVIDCCGVKRLVLDAVLPISHEYGFIFIGGHPMAGIEHSGFEYSMVDLFNGASMILTPDASADIVILDSLKHFFLSIGFGRIQISGPDEHDRIIAYTSQLAHVLSSAYVKSEAAMQHSGFSAGSFQDMTRVALLNEDMWTELFLANSDNLADEVGALAKRLTQYADAIREHDEEGLKALLRDGRERKEYLTERDAK